MIDDNNNDNNDYDDDNNNNNDNNYNNDNNDNDNRLNSCFVLCPFRTKCSKYITNCKSIDKHFALLTLYDVQYSSY